MDMNNLLQIAATTFMQSKMSGNSGSALDTNSLISALSRLSGSTSSNGFDIGELLGKMQSGDMANIAQSWLGDGQNSEISDNQVTEMLGEDKISDFASQLGLSREEAMGGLRDTLPQMVDKASSGGSLLDSIGGVGDAINLANKIFGR